jgi:hypothetical protein
VAACAQWRAVNRWTPLIAVMASKTRDHRADGCTGLRAAQRFTTVYDWGKLGVLIRLWLSSVGENLARHATRAAHLPLAN